MSTTAVHRIRPRRHGDPCDNDNERSPPRARTDRRPQAPLRPPTEPSVSILDAKGGHMPAVLAQMLAATWVWNVLYDAWSRGELRAEFALLGRQLQPQMCVVVALNAAGGLSTFSSWLLALRPTRAALGVPATVACYVACQVALLLVPPYALWWLHPGYSTLLGLALTLHHASHSYFFTCMMDVDAGCTAKQYLQYIVFPTLVYAPKFSYTRASTFRLGFFLSHMLASLFNLLVMYELLNHCAIPLLMKFPEYGFVEIWIRLMTPAFFGWLVFFYGMFHCFLNAVSEVCMYANRDFYEDWWDSADVAVWARKWNSTVQMWLGMLYVFLRHKVKMSKGAAVATSIMLSASWHDFILSYSFKCLTLFHTIGMTVLVLFIVVAKTPFGKAVNKRIGPYFVLLMWPLGFSMLIATYGITIYWTGKNVVLPHQFIMFCHDYVH
eukprot:m51a1_g5108 hypothetical protein (438) ;mRNA; r:327763-329712